MFSLLALRLFVFLPITAKASILGFNYGAANDNLDASQWQDLFRIAQTLPGAFTAARLWQATSQDGSTWTPAFDAAVATKTNLLLSITIRDDDTSELSATQQALSNFGSSFSDIVSGILVDWDGVFFNRRTVSQVVADINTVRSAFQNTPLANVPIGTSNFPSTWQNSSIASVLGEASDFIGLSIGAPSDSTVFTVQDGIRHFESLISSVGVVVGSKPMWVVSLGWPSIGISDGGINVSPSISDAQTFWDGVGCAEVFNRTSVFWNLLDEISSSNSYSNGILDSTNQALFNLSCTGPPDSTISTSTSPAVSASSASIGPTTVTVSVSPGHATPTGSASDGPAASTDSVAKGSSASAGSTSTGHDASTNSVSIDVASSSIATTSLSVGSTVAATAASSTVASNTGGTSDATKIGAGVGGGVGGAVALAILVGAILYYLRHKSKSNPKTYRDSGPGLAID